MWLTRRERKLLAIYAKRSESYNKDCEVSDSDLIKSLSLRDVRELISLKSRLKGRGLLTFSSLDRPRREKHENGKPVGSEEYGEPRISLSEQGFFIGRKCGTTLGIFELWSRENVWFWVALSALLSAIGILVTIFKD